MNKLCDVDSKEVVRVVAEYLLDRGGLVTDAAFGRDDADDVAGTLDESLESLRALALNGDVLEVDPRDGQRGLCRQGSDGSRQLVRDDIGRFDDQHGPGHAHDFDSSDENVARKEAGLLGLG